MPQGSRARAKILAKARGTAIAEYLEDTPTGTRRKGDTELLSGRSFPEEAKHGDEGYLEYRVGSNYGAWFFVGDE